MKGLKIGSLVMATLMAVSLVGCGPMEDPKVRFVRECKQSLSADECQQLAFNKSQEEQARIMKSGQYNSFANQPGGYTTPGYSQPQPQQSSYGQPQYGQPGYGQASNSVADTATGAVLGLAAGAAIGHAIGSRNKNDTTDTRATQPQTGYGNQQNYQQANVPSQPKPVTQPFVDTNKTTRFAAPSTPSTVTTASAPTSSYTQKPSVFSKPVASTPSRPYTAKPSVFSKSSSTRH